MQSERQTILIVDDMPDNLKLLGQVLGKHYRMLCATYGGKGLEIAAVQKPDLILLDIMLPDMDGYEVCAQLKADPLTRSIPVIFITSMNQETDEARGLAIGAIDYITKPFSPAIVQARVHNHLELKRYHDFLENLSATDGLTGIPNRRQFDLFLDREWRRAIRNQSRISLILMDIDFFKAYNDHYGHLSGDDCLRQVARALAEGVQRPGDLMARYGGEEFACVLPETENEGAVCVAHKLQERVNALKVPHACSSVAAHITLSLGVATSAPEAGRMPTDLIQRADQLLYEAKQSGRNQVRSSGPV